MGLIKLMVHTSGREVSRFSTSHAKLTQELETNVELLVAHRLWGWSSINPSITRYLVFEESNECWNQDIQAIRFLSSGERYY